MICKIQYHYHCTIISDQMSSTCFTASETFLKPICTSRSSPWTRGMTIDVAPKKYPMKPPMPNAVHVVTMCYHFSTMSRPSIVETWCVLQCFTSESHLSTSLPLFLQATSRYSRESISSNFSDVSHHPGLCWLHN